MKKPLVHEHQAGNPWPVQDAVTRDQPVLPHPVDRAPTAGGPHRSRRERRKMATREALITAAQDVIAAKGLYLAVIEEITERADVAKGSFYQHFRDRDDLLYVLLTRRLEELRMGIEATPPPGTFATCIRTLIHHHLEYFLQHEDFLLFLHQIRGLITMNRDETPAVREAYRRYLMFVAEWLPTDGSQPPVGHGPTTEEGVCVLLGLLTGFLSHYVLLAPLSTLRHQGKRIETALTTACLAFWQRQG